MRKPNYDRYPATEVEGPLWTGWEAICGELGHVSESRKAIVVECYQGVYTDDVKEALGQIPHSLLTDTRDLMRDEAEIEAMTRPWLTDDRLFGHRANFSIDDFLDPEKMASAKNEIAENRGLSIIIGPGASRLAPEDSVLVYADMARWEIQQRSRRKEICGLGVSNAAEAASLHYKRGYFVDWIVCDNLKKTLMERVDYWLDTNDASNPKMTDSATVLAALDKTARKPFRVVPFFDPAPWGGQWMKKVCGLDPEPDNYGWCFDCVPEENSLLLRIKGQLFELPANDLVFYRTRELLGAPVEARFGQDFPIRFDFLDTMDGGNLSLQVHPTTQYIRDTFGIYYTQDESYYLLDAEPEGATVFLGLRENINPAEMIAALEHSQATGETFDATRYVNKWPAKKHDHFLIPAGTVHCSGAGAMVLEISATPSIFTFKLWDWGRLGLDGLPRPINIGHGKNVIQWERTTGWVKENLVNRVEPLAEGDGWREERTGLHENEFIETRRHWFTKPVTLNTGGGVNVLNLVEGDEAVIESPSGEFEPFVVHYAETFIIPAAVGDYTIRPYGASEGKECGTIKASVRFRN